MVGLDPTTGISTESSPIFTVIAYPCSHHLWTTSSHSLAVSRPTGTPPSREMIGVRGRAFGGSGCEQGALPGTSGQAGGPQAEAVSESNDRDDGGVVRCLTETRCRSCRRRPVGRCARDSWGQAWRGNASFSIETCARGFTEKGIHAYTATQVWIILQNAAPTDTTGSDIVMKMTSSAYTYTWH